MSNKIKDIIGALSGYFLIASSMAMVFNILELKFIPSVIFSVTTFILLLCSVLMYTYINKQTEKTVQENKPSMFKNFGTLKTAIPEELKVKKIVFNNGTTFKLLNNGNLYASGNSSHGEFGNGTFGKFLPQTLVAENVKDIQAQYRYSAYLSKDGNLYETGVFDIELFDYSGVRTGTWALTETKVKEFFLGSRSNLVKHYDGKIKLNGYNGYFGLNDNLFIKGVKKADFSPTTMAVVGENNMLYTIGYNNKGLLGVGWPDSSLDTTKFKLVHESVRDVVYSPLNCAAFITNKGDVYFYGQHEKLENIAYSPYELKGVKADKISIGGTSIFTLKDGVVKYIEILSYGKGEREIEVDEHIVAEGVVDICAIGKLKDCETPVVAMILKDGRAVTNHVGKDLVENSTNVFDEYTFMEINEQAPTSKEEPNYGTVNVESTERPKEVVLSELKQTLENCKKHDSLRGKIQFLIQEIENTADDNFTDYDISRIRGIILKVYEIKHAEEKATLDAAKVLKECTYDTVERQLTLPKK